MIQQQRSPKLAGLKNQKSPTFSWLLWECVLYSAIPRITPSLAAHPVSTEQPGFLRMSNTDPVEVGQFINTILKIYLFVSTEKRPWSIERRYAQKPGKDC